MYIFQLIEFTTFVHKVSNGSFIYTIFNLDGMLCLTKNSEQGKFLEEGVCVMVTTLSFYLTSL